MLLVNQKIVQIYNKLGIEAAKRIKHLSLSDVASTSEEYPVLKHVKGNKIRHFTPVCLELCKLYAADRKGKHRVAMLEALQKIYILLEKKWRDWSPDHAASLQKTGQALLAHYSWLAHSAIDAGEHLYSMVQKHHVFNHLLDQSQFLHPCTVWCYGSESFMGIMVKISSSCTWGTPSHKVTAKVLLKFRLVFHLLLQGYRSLDMADSEEEE